MNLSQSNLDLCGSKSYFFWGGGEKLPHVIFPSSSTRSSINWCPSSLIQKNTILQTEKNSKLPHTYICNVNFDPPKKNKENNWVPRLNDPTDVFFHTKKLAKDSERLPYAAFGHAQFLPARWVVEISEYTLKTKRLEPENHLFEKANHLNPTFMTLAFMLIFEGCNWGNKINMHQFLSSRNSPVKISPS